MPSLIAPALTADAFFAGEQPTLRGDGLVLRPWFDGDRGALLTAYADPAIQHWHGRTLDEAEAGGWATARERSWHGQTAVDWAITDGDGDGEVLGRVAIRRLDLRQGLGEVAYWVLPAARGRRVAARALAVLCDWAFAAQGMHRLELVHSMANPASCRVAERAGFAAEGVKRGEGLHADGWHDVHLHARLADDPPPA